jgi:hypothetical protein
MSDDGKRKFCCAIPECTDYGKWVDFAAISEHLTDAHGLTTPLQGSRHLILHIDGEDYYASRYKWLLNENDPQGSPQPLLRPEPFQRPVIVMEEVTHKRAPDDPMRH